jgi:hypothetical protein
MRSITIALLVALVAAAPQWFLVYGKHEDPYTADEIRGGPYADLQTCSSIWQSFEQHPLAGEDRHLYHCVTERHVQQTPE